ncbi:hypothetical protein [Amycolatopsis sp. NPDC051372]|uniref:hypothetical protein n=1 Tax=Amycolatopsis sp. NPDC051372 TaxID=3155669 RepID=UPI00341C91D5
MTQLLGIPPLSLPTFDAPELTPLRKPQADATVGLLVTYGAYYPDPKRLEQRSDLSYRLLPRERDLSEVLFAHMTPIRAFALADPNVAYPRDTMLDLERAGVIGRYADHAVSMVGSISQYDELATGTAPRIVDEFAAMGVDLVLVVPFCPQCHVAGGVLAHGSNVVACRPPASPRCPARFRRSKPLVRRSSTSRSAARAAGPARPSSNAPSSAPRWRRAPPWTRPTSGRCPGCRSRGRPTAAGTGKRW